MAKQYFVSNPSSTHLCIMGRKRLEIPAQCEKHPCSFSSDEEAKTTITKLKRRYPQITFEPADGSKPEENVTKKPEADGQKEPPAPATVAETPKPESASVPLMDAETFAQNATVERAGSGWCTVTIVGLDAPIKVRISASEPLENAVPRAFGQYTGESKE